MCVTYQLSIVLFIIFRINHMITEINRFNRFNRQSIVSIVKKTFFFTFYKAEYNDNEYFLFPHQNVAYVIKRIR